MDIKIIIFNFQTFYRKYLAACKNKFQNCFSTKMLFRRKYHNVTNFLKYKSYIFDSVQKSEVGD